MARVLVTGGAGFIGSHLCSYLHQEGYDVTSLDIVSQSTTWQSIQADFREGFNLVGYDFIVHLGAKVSIQESILNSEETNSVNVEGTHTLLREAELAKVKKFIFASSAAVYGDQGTNAMAESAQLFPLSPYAESKLMGEELCTASSIQSCCMRFFNVYGLNQSTQGGYAAVIPAFNKAINDKQRLTIYGDGSQIRDFIHVDDIVRLIEQSLRLETLPPVVNIATGVQTTISDLVDVFNSKYDVEGVDYKPPRKGDILFSIADVSLMKRTFQTDGMKTLSEGLE